MKISSIHAMTGSQYLILARTIAALHRVAAAQSIRGDRAGAEIA
jgi:hypothetical protein